MKAKLALVICLLLILVSAGCPDNAPDITPLAPPTLYPDSRLVALYFDDAYVNQYEEALPVLLKYEFRATFAVITGEIGLGQGLTKCMDEAELTALSRYGMEIASHTREHSHLAGVMSNEQLRSEIVDSKGDLEELGFTVNTLVYPYFEYDAEVMRIAQEAGYECARAGWPETGAYDLNATDPLARYHIAATSITNNDMASFKVIVGEASRTSVVCLVYHFISDTGPAETSTSLADFSAQMAYLHDGGYTVVLLSELIGQ